MDIYRQREKERERTAVQACPGSVTNIRPRGFCQIICVLILVNYDKSDSVVFNRLTITYLSMYKNNPKSNGSI